MKVSTTARELLDLTFQLGKSREICRSLVTDIERLKCEKASEQSRAETLKSCPRSREFLELDQTIRQLKDERKTLQRRQDEQKIQLDALTRQIQALKIGKDLTAAKLTEAQVTSESLSGAACDEQSRKKQLLTSIDRTKQQIQRNVETSQQLVGQIGRQKVHRDRAKERHDQLAARHEKLEQERLNREHKLTKLLQEVRVVSKKLTDGQKSRRQMSHLLQNRQLELSRLRVQLIRLQQRRKKRK